MEPIGKLANIVVTSSRFDEMLSFYSEKLGLASFYRDQTSCFFKAGGVNFVVVRGKDEPKEPVESVCLDFGVSDLAIAADRLSIAGIQVDQSDPNVLKFRDPDGNLIELVKG